MRSPEEIKKGLEYCSEKAKRKTNCSECIYFNDPRGWCSTAITKDALDYIQLLEARMEALTDETLAYIQQLEQRLVEANKTSMRWISVGERLPEDDGYFLCYRNDGSPEVVCMYYGDGDFLTPEPELNNISHVITHWMPLPQSPEEEEK